MKQYTQKAQRIIRRYFPYVLFIIKSVLKKVLVLPVKIVRVFFRKKVLKICAILFLLGVLGILGTFLYFWSTLDESIDAARNYVVPSSKYYDRTGKIVLYDDYTTQKRTYAPLDTIPIHMQEAAIVAEDDNFYSHFGVDVSGVIRSAWTNIIKGEVSQGGSTITQQFIKNILFTPEQGVAQRTIGRKIKETILSIELEIKYSKEEILELYLNQIPYGSSIYGVATASEAYFNKPIQDITLGEAALLASLPQAPSRYLNNPEELEIRRKHTLYRMKFLGYITDQQYEDAVSEELAIHKAADVIKAPHFVLEVKEQLEELYGPERVEAGGLRVITTLDVQTQEVAEQVITRYASRNETTYGATNAALVAIDQKTGDVLAMVGSRDYFEEEIDGNVNVAMRERQPGSSFKPFAYAQALREGYTIDTVVYDVLTEFNPRCSWEGDQEVASNGTKCYSPDNWDGKYMGPQPLKEALAQSRNIPAIKVLHLAGIEDTIDLATDMGISTLQEKKKLYGLALVLGGGEVTLLEETSAYGVFATGGVRSSPRFVLEVKDHKGDIEDSFTGVRTKRVLEENVAHQITHALSKNEYRAPEVRSANLTYVPGITTAVKTGTTQGFRDAWTVGYTPSISVGVWVGNNDGSLMKPGSYGSVVASPIWKTFLTDLYKEKQEQEDPQEGVFTLPNPSTESFPRASIPRTSKDILNGETDEIFPHSILHFVKKDDPQGSVPNNPEREDELYEHFERQVRLWAGVEYGEDKVIDTSDIIMFISPSEDYNSFRNESVPLDFIVSTPDEIETITILLDGEEIEKDDIANQNTISTSKSLFINNLERGIHTITVRVSTKTNKVYVANQPFWYNTQRIVDPIDFINIREWED